jgi:AraC-like DNA-binding protein
MAVLGMSPSDVARRQGACWGPLAGEVVQVTQQAMFETQFCASAHLLIAADRGERHEGETFLEGLPRSSLRNMSRKLTLVPAGRRFHASGHGLPSGDPVRPGGLADWQAKRTAEYIEAHLADPISLANLAAIARLSPYHFARAFKRSFGMPPHRLHTARRIERAKTLLAQPTLSITEIALEVGFGETSSFTAAFRRLVGCTPSSYRRSLS